MTQDPLKTTEIEIGRKGNTISHDNDGNMVLKDKFVTVKLADLASNINNNGGSGGKKSFTIEVQSTDWAFERLDSIYNRSFWSVNLYYNVHGVNVDSSDITKFQITTNEIISQSPLVLEDVKFEDIIIYTDRIKIISSSKIHCYINLEVV